MFLSQTIAGSSARSPQSWPVVDQGEAGSGGGAEEIQERTGKIASELEWAGGRSGGGCAGNHQPRKVRE